MDANTQIIQTQPTVASVDDIINDTTIPKIFANGIQCGFTLSEGNIILKHSNATVCLITMGFPTIKSLRIQLDTLINSYEKNTKQTVLSIEELTTKFNEQIKEKK